MSVTRGEHGAVEPVHVAQQQQVAVGRPHGSEGGVRGMLDAVLDTREIVLTGRAGRAAGELVEAALPDQRPQPRGRLRGLGAAVEIAPAECERATQQRSPSPRPPSMRALYENSGVS